MSFSAQFNYNRDKIVSGTNLSLNPPNGFTGSPEYGAKMNFTSKLSKWRGNGFNTFITPQGVNNINLDMNFSFADKKENIKSLISRISNLTTGVLTGQVALSGTRECLTFGEVRSMVEGGAVKINLDTDYYKNFDGSQVKSFSVENLTSGVHRLNLQLYNNRQSPFLNRGMGFVNPEKLKSPQDASFEKFDVIYAHPYIRLDGEPNGGGGDFVTLHKEGNSRTIFLDGPFDIEFTFDADDFGTSASLDGAHFISNHRNGLDGGRSRVWYYQDAIDNLAITDNNGVSGSVFAGLGGGGGNLSNGFTGNLDTKVRITRDSSNRIRGYINDVIQPISKRVYTDAVIDGNITLNCIGGQQAASTNIPHLQGSMWDIRISGGSTLKEIYKVDGYGNKTFNWGYNGQASNPITARISGNTTEISGHNKSDFDNYFYVTKDISGPLTSTSLAGLSTYTGVSSSVTRTFFFRPDKDVSLNFDHQNKQNNFQGSFTQTLNLSRNSNSLNEFDLTFSNRGQKETYAILHFLESHLGYKKFVYDHKDNLINTKRVCICTQWSHTFNYKNSNTIQARFMEVTNPITPNF